MIPATILVLVCVFYRLAIAWAGGAEWMNFSPMAAITLCSAIFLPRTVRWLLPVVALLISDLLLNAFYHADWWNWEMGIRYVALGSVAGLAILAGSKVRPWPALFGAALAASVWFYLLTNTASWLAEPGYAKNWGGWTQALTLGLPGYPPTWQFFARSLGSDLMFTGLFVASLASARFLPGVVADHREDAALNRPSAAQ